MASAHGLVEVALGPQLDRSTISVFGGSSRATCPWCGAAGRAASAAPGAAACARSPPLLDGRAEQCSRRSGASLAQQPGIRKSNSDHSSPRWFSSGVPVRHRRWRALQRRSGLAALALRVLDALRLVEHQQRGRVRGEQHLVLMSRASSG
jgi:hypothetical protein